MSDSAQAYRRNAYQFHEAAKLISEENHSDQYLAPCCHNLGISLELYLKSILIDAGKRGELKCYGHDILRMWNEDWAEHVTAFAYEAAPSNMHRILAGPGVQANAASLLEPRLELDRHIDWLSKAYSSDSKYALRYPPVGQTTVPSPEFLIPIFEHMFDSGPR